MCIHSIAVDCEWGDWVNGDCSTTCGTGEQNNTRTKLIEEAHGGNCTGAYTDVTSCFVAECPGMYLNGIFNKKSSAYFIISKYMLNYSILIRCTGNFTNAPMDEPELHWTIVRSG